MEDRNPLLQKAVLRGLTLKRRDALSLDERAEASERIAERCETLTFGGRPEAIAGYLPIHSEVDPRPAMARLAARGVRIAVPAIEGEELEFREFSATAALVGQRFGTLAPGPEAPVVTPQVLLMPLAAFDRRGGRIGYGRAFYDRAVAALRTAGHDPLLIGLAFAVQEVEAVPMEPHDVRLHLIITECEVIRPE
ncbi:5-formyltetrahydrofolate cyclo-ligase [Consotaella salsifontis]|uniref:5-formyltetrahydrofolate cyclo-ligase n=1 Tax=Consotaella salsifontis TaxID=1365950 RepID=A0A1T4T441_9HYPH|nr:5-formyltetrahydrofolate cyclo-ligase [Consotaella salsifontis]SKA35157.1 5-formyltetrahydrofolate cyclo-ligase [Consotaella salsifontis]